MALLEPEDDDQRRFFEEMRAKASDLASFEAFLANPDLSVNDILRADGDEPTES